MTDAYTRGIISRARQMEQLEAAAVSLPAGSALMWRAGLATALAALMMMIPSISAAQMIL